MRSKHSPSSRAHKLLRSTKIHLGETPGWSCVPRNVAGKKHFPHKKLELDISMAQRETSEAQSLKIPGQEDSRVT